MLILTRKLNEEIVLNSETKIKILSIGDNQVKIGIDAPTRVKIFRGELFDRIKQETEEAMHKSSEIVVNISKLKLNKLK